MINNDEVTPEEEAQTAATRRNFNTGLPEKSAAAEKPADETFDARTDADRRGAELRKHFKTG